MTTNDRDRALDELLQKVELVAKSPPSLEALYALDGGFEYTDFWYQAWERLRELIVGDALRSAWASELKRPPPDIRLWLPFIYRRETTEPGIQQAVDEWEAKGDERFFVPHHYVPGIGEGVAALHMTLLGELEPVAAVEYAAELPNEYFVWPAAHRLQLSKRREVVDQVVRESSSERAVLLCLACELDALRTLFWDARTNSGDEPANVSQEGALSETVPIRCRALARLVLGRGDAAAIVAPLMRHLVRSNTRSGSNNDLDDRSEVARIALEQLLLETKGSSLELARSTRPDAACVVARMLLAHQRQDGASYWAEWVELVRAEHRSLNTDNPIYWRAPADALRRETDPYVAWMNSVRMLEPVLRLRARRNDRGVDPGIHLIMPAVNAAAVMGADGKTLWWSLFERARRHFFVDSPPKNEFGYRLCSYVFGAFPRVFGDAQDTLKSALALLPTPDHVAWAMAQLPANQDKTPEPPSGSEVQSEAPAPTQEPPT